MESYYERNKNKILSRQLIYNKKNADKISKYNNEYYAKNRETIDAKRKERIQKKRELQKKTIARVEENTNKTIFHILIEYEKENGFMVKFD